MNKKTISITFFVVFLIAIGLYGYTQVQQKSSLSLVLQNKIDVSSPPEKISAISTLDQNLPDGTLIPKGTKFTGMLINENNAYIIYFDSYETPEGSTAQLLAKSSICLKNEKQAAGVSAKIGKTFQQQTKSNVLGAIFNTTGNRENDKLPSSVIPLGYSLRVEVN